MTSFAPYLGRRGKLCLRPEADIANDRAGGQTRQKRSPTFLEAGLRSAREPSFPRRGLSTLIVKEQDFQRGRQPASIGSQGSSLDAPNQQESSGLASRQIMVPAASASMPSLSGPFRRRAPANHSRFLRRLM
jgi:hypothetical protein